MNEIPTKCSTCKDKPCEDNPYNPDQECWTSAVLYQLEMEAKLAEVKEGEE